MEDPPPTSEASIRRSKRTRAPTRKQAAREAEAENRERDGEASDHAERESSPDEFDEARPKSKRPRASEGTSSVARKAADLSLIGKLEHSLISSLL
ncbi:hypothetical protein PIB30_092444 [Stylosanthes scabra]|uniref:Uncharacterized protein n=1 Tax=Stylosanthes scabra TaxID=79078 RepID=A0ABU6WVX5_9FABA|nr:hypothetical protein [Stylosanthes scabra]